ncbi:MAG: DnaB-like helicase N-terminal domain-containing protein [Acidimicrobiales bacterium]
MSGTRHGRALPQDLVAEESLLGAMLLAPGAIAAAAATVTADDFYRPAHGHIFETIVAMVARRVPVDPVTVADELARRDLLGAIGGPAVLLTLQAGTPSTSSAARYATIVARCAGQRRLVRLASEIWELGYTGGEDCWDLAERAVHAGARLGPGTGFGPFEPSRLDLDAAPERAPLLARGLYGGGLTLLASEPGVGKSWVALWWTARLIGAGRGVIYLDAEMGCTEAALRLRALGADRDGVHDRLAYVPFPDSTWSGTDLGAWRRLVATVATRDGGLALVVVDATADFLVAAGRDEDRAAEVTSWVAQVCGPVREAGGAVLMLDHLRKPEAGAKRSRYSRGSSAKLAKVDGALLVEAPEPFDATRSGRLSLWATKDRRGYVGVPGLSKPPLDLVVRVAGERLTITEHEPAQPVAESGPTECMAAVMAALGSRGSLTTAEIEELVVYRRTTVAWALSRLVEDGLVDLGPAGPRRRGRSYSLAGAGLFAAEGTDELW